MSEPIKPLIPIRSVTIDTPEEVVEKQEEESLFPSTEGMSTRKQVAKRLGISTATLMRWERKGDIPEPIRTLSACYYTEEMVEKVKEVIKQKLSQPRTLERKAGILSSTKQSKRLERLVAGHISSLTTKKS